MKHFFVAFALVCPAFAAHATTYQFELKFENEGVAELQTGFDRDATCFAGQPCFPDGFRPPNGYFSDLQPGDMTTAVVDLENETAEIAGWSVTGDLMQSASIAQFFNVAPTGVVLFDTDKVTVVNEGPSGSNPSGVCDPSTPASGLPSGFCGFFGYEASFEVVSISEVTVSDVPVPAAAFLLLSGVAFLGFASKRTVRRKS